MDAPQLQLGLIQLLQHYERSGIRHFRQSASIEIPAEWTASISTPAQQQASSAPSGLDTQAIPSTSLRRANPSANAATVAAVRSDSADEVSSRDSQATAPPTPLRSGVPVAVRNLAGDWTLPQLSTEEKNGLLQGIDAEVRACRKCTDIVCYRRRTVLGEGNVHPKIAFFGEAPGADEDAQGRPFVGAAGQLLNNIIKAMKLQREDVYILNSLKCRPPQNRTPLPDEIANCFPYAERQLEILQPEYIILLGAVAVRAILQSTESVGRLRGRFHQYRRSKVLVTYHPAYLLRNPAAKKSVWEDVQMVMKELGLG